VKFWRFGCALGVLVALHFGFAQTSTSHDSANTPNSGMKPEAIYVRGAKIYPVSGGPIEHGVLIVRGGKIEAVGPESALSVPKTAHVIDGKGKVIIPGIVDSHSHIGGSSRPAVPANADINEGTGPIQPGLRVMDAIYPADPGIRMALAGGITTANIMPGSGNVIGGQTVYVKLRGKTIEDMLIPGTIGGLKMANGENPKHYGAENQAPMTRMEVAALARKEFIKAQDYKRKWDEYNSKASAGDKDAKPPERDLDLEPLVQVLEGKRIVQHHTHRADDIMTVLRLTDEFHFRVVIHHGTESYKVADELAKRKIPVTLTITDSPGGKLEATGVDLEAAAILDKAGVKVAVNTDDFINSSRFLLREAALTIRGGLSQEVALRALTINPAAMLDLQDRVGSLERGKDADFVVLSGEPFSVYTKVLETWIEGQKVFDRSDPLDLRYQTGGFQVVNRYPKLLQVPAGGAQ
jgi:imidazolonepropionase-like amidohydrolase